MKKNLNTSGIINELRGGSSYFRPAQPDAASVDEGAPASDAAAGGTPTQAVAESSGRSTNQSTTGPTKQSTEAAANQQDAGAFDHSAVLGRPKAFYITQQQDKDLDHAVSRLSERVAGKVDQKIDRSTVVRLLLEEAQLTTPATIDRLYKRLVSRLISQLTGQSTG